MVEDEHGNLHDDEGKFTDKNSTSNPKQKIAHLLDKIDNAKKKHVTVLAKGEIKSPAYAVLGDRMKSREFVLLKSQVQKHIDTQRHPEDFKRYVGRVGEILNHPDVIFDGRESNSVVVVKKLDQRVSVALWLSTDSKKANYIKTIYVIHNEKQFERRLQGQNGWKVLYKKDKRV